MTKLRMVVGNISVVSKSRMFHESVDAPLKRQNSIPVATWLCQMLNTLDQVACGFGVARGWGWEVPGSSRWRGRRQQKWRGCWP